MAHTVLERSAQISMAISACPLTARLLHHMYDPSVWSGTWGYPTPRNVSSLYMRIGRRHFPMIRGGRITAKRKEALLWFQRYWPFYSMLTSLGRPLPQQCNVMGTISGRVAELWEMVKSDPNDFPPPV
jgi:hypothetical protein